MGTRQTNDDDSIIETNQMNDHDSIIGTRQAIPGNGWLRYMAERAADLTENTIECGSSVEYIV